jgi:F0F1-type ATP synthase assembly protein I
MWDQPAMQFRKVVVSAIVLAIVIGAYYLADEYPDTEGWLLVVGVAAVGIGAAFWLVSRLR